MHARVESVEKGYIADFFIEEGEVGREAAEADLHRFLMVYTASRTSSW